jgi:3-hydroxyisobutyrate dehydrogenase-like beta-hydroxyacid dehydrogenase
VTASEVGWLGTGEMGGLIARRLAEQGCSVVAWNRTRERAAALEPLGVQVVDSPREVAERTSAIFAMLTDARAVREVITGEDGVLSGLAAGAIVVDMSTIAPEASRALAAEVAAAGGVMLDCPVSGGIGAAPTGDLSLMVGGDRDAANTVRPILDIIGKRVTHMGDNGQALVMKIAINVSLAVQMLAFSEGVLLAELNGVERSVAVEATLNSAVSSPMLRHRGPAVLAGALPDPAWFNCGMMQKDLLLALEMARASGLPMPSTALVNEWMTACRGSGRGAEDFSVVFHALAEQAGVTELEPVTG